MVNLQIAEVYSLWEIDLYIIKKVSTPLIMALQRNNRTDADEEVSRIKKRTYVAEHRTPSHLCTLAQYVASLAQSVSSRGVSMKAGVID